MPADISNPFSLDPVWDLHDPSIKFPTETIACSSLAPCGQLPIARVSLGGLNVQPPHMTSPQPFRTQFS